MKNFIKNIKSIKINYFKFHFLTFLTIILIVIFSIFSGIFLNLNDKFKNNIVVNHLEYNRKTSFNNTIKSLANLFALTKESSLSYELIDKFQIMNLKEEFIFYIDLEELKIEKEKNQLDLKFNEDKELKYLRSEEYSSKIENIYDLKNIFKFFDEDLSIIEIINDEIFRNFYLKLIQNKNISDSFTNEFKNIFKNFMPNKISNILYSIRDGLDDILWVEKILDFLNSFFYEPIDKIPEEITSDIGKKIYLLIKFYQENLNKHFKDNLDDYKVKLKQEGKYSEENEEKRHFLYDRFSEKLIPLIGDDFKIIIENNNKKKIELNIEKILHELELDNSFVNKYPQKIFSELKKLLFENSAKLFVGLFARMIVLIPDFISKKHFTGKFFLNLDEHDYQSAIYLFKLILFLNKINFSDEINNLEEYLLEFLSVFKKFNIFSKEMGFFKNEIKEILKSEKDHEIEITDSKTETESLLKKTIKLKDDFLFSFFGSDEKTVLVDQIINYFLKFYQNKLELKIKNLHFLFEKILFDDVKIESKINEVVKDLKKKFNLLKAKIVEIKKLINELLNLIKNDNLENKEYIDQLKNLFEEIISLIESLTEELFVNEYLNTNAPLISFKWIINILNILLNEFGFISKNFKENISDTIVEILNKNEKSEEILIEFIEFIKLLGKDVFLNLFSVYLKYKDKYSTQKLSYCYLKVLIRVDDQTNCDDIKEIDIQKLIFNDLNENINEQYIEGSIIQKKSILAKIIDVITDIKVENGEFEKLKTFFSKLFDVDFNIFDKIWNYFNNEYEENFGFYIDSNNWKYSDGIEEWNKFYKEWNNPKKKDIRYSFIGELKRGNKIIYSYLFKFDIDSTTSEIKLKSLEKLS